MAHDAAAHLSTIDASAWPGIATVPHGPGVRLRARRAEAEFARACAKAGLELDLNAPAGPDITVDYDALFARIAVNGWVGLAESYMASEWSTRDSDTLVKVLSRLISAGYHPRTKLAAPADGGGELPGELVALYAGDGLSHGGGIFSTGVPTTVRTSVDNFAARPGRRSEPKELFLDDTTMSEPDHVDRSDLGDAQRRSADWLCQAARITASSHVLVMPGSGLQPAIVAAQRRATVDVLTADDQRWHQASEDLVLEGVDDSVHCALVDFAVPGPREWRGHYDAVLSTGLLDTLAPNQQTDFARALERLLSPSGRAVVESTMVTGAMVPAARAALGVLQAYIWPGYNPLTGEEWRKLVDRHSRLRVIAQTRLGAHTAESLAHQRSFFEGRQREAAVAGFDPVFRRLWVYQFALREALFRHGMLDTFQMTLIHRNRGGRR